MKTPLWPAFAVAGFTAVATAFAAHVPASSGITIPFVAKVSAGDLKIERVTAEALGEQVRFTINYTSGCERYLSFFDPPSGATIKVLQRGALKPDGKAASIVVPAGKLRQVAAITLRFSNGESADANHVYLTVSDEAARPIFGERRQTGAKHTTLPTEIPASRDLRWKDVSGRTDLTAGKITDLTYNEATRWSSKDAEISKEILRRGMEPGLGIRSLHRAGIIGRGVSVGIIDQNIFLDHPEFKDRIARYHDVGCNAKSGSMHGPAVASLLAGKNIGTAPGARLYFVAAPSWTRDAKYQADALHWLLDLNATLAPIEKIRVVSVSAAPSGEGTMFTKNNELWDAACARAEREKVLVLDCTAHRGVIGAGYFDPADPDDLSRLKSNYSGRNEALRAKRIFTPMRRRTVAEEYTQGQCSYQYDGAGGLSWAIPYAAGVLAMGWQVNPALSGERMVELLRETAYEKDGLRFIDPVAFVEAVKARGAPAGG